MDNINTHFRTCNLCEAMCGLEIKHRKGKILSIQGDKDDVLSKGHICPKAVALKDLYQDEDRLKTPIKKTATGWEKISWSEAFDEVARKITAIQNKHGKNAVAVYQGNPNVHNLGLMLFGRPFIKSLQTKQRYTATSVDQLPHHITSLMMFGHQMMIPIPDLDRTDFLLILGANPAVSNGSMLSAPRFAKRIKKIISRGGQVINIDPRFTETSKISSQHIYINPGKDVLLLLSILHVIFDKKLTKKGHLIKQIKGWEKIEEIVKNYSPEFTHKFIGILPEVIEALAIQFASAQTAVCYGRLGVSTQEFGGMCHWLINVLNIVTDNTDKPGGAMFTQPVIDLVLMSGMQGRTGSFDRYRSRVNNLPEYSGEFPVATLADEILSPGNDQIKVLICIAGNPVLSTPNGTKLEKGLAQLEYMVSLDIYLNETSKYANIILPSTTGLECAHYDLAFHQLAIRNTTKYSTPLFEKEEEQKHDWQILNELTERLSGQRNSATPEMMLDAMLMYSPYKKEKLSVQKIKEAPHGIDFGALQPCLLERIFTPDKKIDLAPTSFVADLKRLDTQIELWKKTADTDFPFHLIGRRQLRNNNSWMHNAQTLIKGKNRCTLLMNTQDATQLNIKNNQLVRVISFVHQLEIPVELDDHIKSGVVSIPHGFGHNRKGIKIKLAQRNAGVSINDLTNDKKVDALTGNADFSGTRVRIEGIV